MTGFGLDPIRAVIDARLAYLVLMDIADPDAAEDLGVDLVRDRELHADVLEGWDSDQPEVDFDNEAIFICRRTKLQRVSVIELMLADTIYQSAVGIMETEAVDDFYEWLEDEYPPDDEEAKSSDGLENVYDPMQGRLTLGE